MASDDVCAVELEVAVVPEVLAEMQEAGSVDFDVQGVSGGGAVSEETIKEALGCTPADETAVSFLTPIISETDITAGSAASSGRPYHVIE